MRVDHTEEMLSRPRKSAKPFGVLPVNEYGQGAPAFAVRPPYITLGQAEKGLTVSSTGGICGNDAYCCRADDHLSLEIDRPPRKPG